MHLTNAVQVSSGMHLGSSAILESTALAVGWELFYIAAMSSVHEIENAISKLSRPELSAFRDWFTKFDAGMWDKQFEEDVAAGRLDALADEAVRDLREGRCRDL